MASLGLFESEGLPNMPLVLEIAFGSVLESTSLTNDLCDRVAVIDVQAFAPGNFESTRIESELV